MNTALVALALLVAGCASLPAGVIDRPRSQAYEDRGGTLLGEVAAATAREAPPGASGIRLLIEGDAALEARLALARRAQRSLDVQYYQIASDATGLRFLRELRAAAARGVRVRVLVDDLSAGQQGALLAGLAAQAGIEVRLFNPLPVRRGSMLGRVVLSAHEFARINRRMHNKLFAADGAFAIVGGRNIGDAYFDRGGPANFIDLDVLASGPVVAELGRAFDRYWNSPQAYPVQSLHPEPGEFAVEGRRFDDAVQDAGDDHDRAGESPGRVAGREASALARELSSGRVAMTFAPVRVLADDPAKAMPPPTSGPQERVGRDTERCAAEATTHEDAPDNGRADAGERRSADPACAGVFQRTLALIDDARREVLVTSPYFVPGTDGLSTLRGALAKAAQVTVITNSLAATDEPLVHVGYARYRRALLQMGVALYEVMAPNVAWRPEAATDGRASLGRLHAKLTVIDGRRLVVGSMNMDLRSARWNTELSLVIESESLAEKVRVMLRGEHLPGSYRLRLADASRIEWVTSRDGVEVVHAREPRATAAGQFQRWLQSRFVSEDLL